MDKNNLNKSLFTNKVDAIYAGYPNIADVLRASDEGVLQAVNVYSQRCGHVPLDNISASYVLVAGHTVRISSQLEYLSKIYKKTLIPKTASELNVISKSENKKVIVVPYISVSETEKYLSSHLENFEIWALPPQFTHILKNKAESHLRIQKSQIPNLSVPDFEVTDIDALTETAEKFIKDKVLKIYSDFDVPSYTPGIMVRFVECDGNYGAGVVKALKNRIVFHPDGARSGAQDFDNWKDAMKACAGHIRSTINPQKEKRVIISRLIETADSPGMSIALIDGNIASLGWNSQLQSGGTACIGTGSYKPKNSLLKSKKKLFEEQTLTAFEAFLRKQAREINIDFNNLNAFINIDLIIPDKSESDLQKKRFGSAFNYISESNPRFTNWTDAVLTGVAAQGKKQTVSSMMSIIKEGIEAEDKVKLPKNVSPEEVRSEIFKKDLKLSQYGTRIIARMTQSPMGIIYMGNIPAARKELNMIIKKLKERGTI